MNSNQPYKQAGDWNDMDDGRAPTCTVEGSVAAPVPTDIVRGKLTKDAPLAKHVWFKSGGNVDWLFEPADLEDLRTFLEALDPSIPVMPLGVGSNMIIRDGGVPGVVIKLGAPFADVKVTGETTLQAGAFAPASVLARRAAKASIDGLRFFIGIPGSVGGVTRMNGGCYGRETCDVLVDCDVILPGGEFVTLTNADLQYSYRHSALPEGAVVVAVRFEGFPGDPKEIKTDMARISNQRKESQPIGSMTGGSTFKNPEGHSSWKLIDDAGLRGFTHGGAQVSDKHCNFLINTGTATSTDIEELGELVREKVYANSGIQLEWEIRRVGRP
ncbi:UDP-N-acetylmuramate dehydrogenase [uncultured Erythrobacter sp.]|uniref:UDP-N-acetylmuramate dehydrogenase n=1 Tax=uncultured Erythrobacter sp. TaxID=263913 RepID=UPI002612AE4E|nr:UDP-N-acetylmuramate dehydrogenase [uncultured Erythrobacter sp.]